jgi:DNA-binding LacI/PurR family transcriptional regulator
LNNLLRPEEAQSAGGTPKHERLRNYLVGELGAGRLKPGDLLPTELALARSAEVSRNTVRHALGELERSGLIRRVRGSGTYVHESARERLRPGLDIFALVLPDTRRGFYPSLQRGFQEASAEGHNQVIICNTDNDPMRQADALLQVMDKKIAGVAIVPTTFPATPAHQLRPLRERNIPVVFCHRRVEGIQAPLVAFSAMEVGKCAARAIVGEGHRRAAFFAFERAGLSSRYESGLRDGLAGAGGELPEDFVCYDQPPRTATEHEEFLEKSLRRLLGGAKPPTAIFSPFDAETESIYLLLNKMGVKIPEEISLVSFGGTWREGALTRRLSAVTVDEEELGRNAVKLLEQMRRLERPMDDASEIIMPLTWAAGETLGPAPKLAAMGT